MTTLPQSANKSHIDKIRHEMTRLEETISSLNSYIANNKYDPSSSREAEEDLAIAEGKYHALQKELDALIPVKPETPSVKQATNDNTQVVFGAVQPLPMYINSITPKPSQPRQQTLFHVHASQNTTISAPQPVVISAKALTPDEVIENNNINILLYDLRQQYRTLDDRMDRLSERMFADDINMDSNCRSADLVRQAALDMIDHRAEYDYLDNRLRAVSAEIHELESRQRKLGTSR